MDTHEYSLEYFLYLAKKTSWFYCLMERCMHMHKDMLLYVVVVSPVVA